MSNYPKVGALGLHIIYLNSNGLFFNATIRPPLSSETSSQRKYPLRST
jgi:hypothetical protein